MIFITVGTEKFAFDRLLSAVHNALNRNEIAAQVFAQTGTSKKDYPLFESKGFMSYEDMVNSIEKADVIITHAGAGSVLLSISLNKIPIIFPRRATFKEHLDNHQFELASKLEKAGNALVAYTENDLIEKIVNYKRLITQLKNEMTCKTDLLNYLAHIIE